MKGKDIYYLAVAGIALYTAYKVYSGVSSVGKIWDALTFSPASMGPDATLTKDAQAREADYLAKGYMKRLADGSTVITPLGEEYIKQQQANAAGGQ